MKRNRHTPEQAVRKVREGERMLDSGSDLAEVLRHLEITESTWHRWRRAYAGMSVPSHEILLRSRLGLMQGDADVQTVPEES